VNKRAEEIASCICKIWMRTASNFDQDEADTLAYILSLPELAPKASDRIAEARAAYEKYIGDNTSNVSPYPRSIAPKDDTDRIKRLELGHDEVVRQRDKWMNRAQNAETERDENARIIKELFKAATGRDLELSDTYSLGDAVCDVNQHVNILGNSRDSWKKDFESSNAIVAELHQACDGLMENVSNLREKLKESFEIIHEQDRKLKSQPCVGVTKDHVKAALVSVINNDTMVNLTPKFIERLAAALSPKWIKFEDRFPEMGQKVWLSFPDDRNVMQFVRSREAAYEFDGRNDNGIAATVLHKYAQAWMPVVIPEPPKEEESELVKAVTKELQE